MVDDLLASPRSPRLPDPEAGASLYAQKSGGEDDHQKLIAAKRMRRSWRPAMRLIPSQLLPLLRIGRLQELLCAVSPVQAHP